MLEVNETNFDQDVLNAEKPVLADFWAPWCQPCRQVAPILEQLAEEHKDTITIAKIDIDKSPGIAAKLRIKSIPTFVLFHKGKVLGAMQGAQPKAAFEKFLAANVPSLKPPTITVADLASTLERIQPVHVFDVRDERDYARSHLRHARCVSPENLDAELEKIPPNELVVLVCRTGERSKAEAAKRSGRTLVALEKGLLEWEGSGKPTYSTKEEQELA